MSAERRDTEVNMVAPESNQQSRRSTNVKYVGSDIDKEENDMEEPLIYDEDQGILVRQSALGLSNNGSGNNPYITEEPAEEGESLAKPKD